LACRFFGFRRASVWAYLFLPAATVSSTSMGTDNLSMVHHRNLLTLTSSDLICPSLWAGNFHGGFVTFQSNQRLILLSIYLSPTQQRASITGTSVKVAYFWSFNLLWYLC
jgi:hypothetical protein